MREHALPQDVTGYRFHIIGNMTVKQFAEVAGGCGIGLLIYTTNLPFLLKWILIAIFAAMGAIAAFLPVAERPFDQWLMAFIRALYRPTKFFWKRDSKIPAPMLFQPKQPISSLVKDVDLSPAKRQRLIEYMRSINSTQAIDSEDQELEDQAAFISELFMTDLRPIAEQPAVNFNPIATAPATSLPVVDAPPSAPSEVVIPKELQDAPQVQVKPTTPPAPASGSLEMIATNVLTGMSGVTAITKSETTTPADTVTSSSASPTPSRPVEIPNIEKIHITPTQDVVTSSQPTMTPEQLSNAQQYVEASSITPTPLATPSEAAHQNPNLPIPVKPTEPNKVVGMVIDQNSAPVPNAIVEILTASGIPARAVKTNILGQFFISTPLTNGTYTIRAEKDGLTFSTYSLLAQGQVIEPIEVKST